MKREERRRKIHDSLLNMLYPPPPSPPPQQEESQRPVNVNAIQIPDEDELEEEKSSSSSSGEFEPQKLSRAQRKRLRRKKLKEAASQRRKIIGPLLPTPADAPIRDGEDVIENEHQGVRRNDLVDLDDSSNYTIPEDPKDDTPFRPQNESHYDGGQAYCSNQNKVKQRRMAKKQVREEKGHKDG